MKSIHCLRNALAVTALLVFPCLAQDAAPAGTLRVHKIFSSNMVIQRGKPIRVWGWAKPGQTVNVQLGAEKAAGQAQGAAPVNMERGQRALERNQSKEMQTDAEARLEYRKLEEPKRAMEIYERLKTLGKSTN